MCKYRGIKLNYISSQLVNFDSIGDMILNEEEKHEIVVHTDKKMKRKKGDGGLSIITEPEDKICRISFHKLRRLSDNNSVPFGCIRSR
jgi:hypothetical protein